MNPPNVSSSPISRIVLTGFMGAGKSTVGAILAAELGWDFVDVDQTLVEAEGASISALFELAGEAAFRNLETKAIAELLDLERVVIAIGGGALESEMTRTRLFGSPGTHVVFLKTPLDVALARCTQQAGDAVRPVLRDRAAVVRRFEQRLEHYGKAHRTISTVNRSPAELARLLADALMPQLQHGRG